MWVLLLKNLDTPRFDWWPGNSLWFWETGRSILVFPGKASTKTSLKESYDFIFIYWEKSIEWSCSCNGEHSFCANHFWLCHYVAEQNSSEHTGLVDLEDQKGKWRLEVHKISFSDSAIDQRAKGQIRNGRLLVRERNWAGSFGLESHIVLPNRHKQLNLHFLVHFLELGFNKGLKLKLSRDIFLLHLVNHHSCPFLRKKSCIQLLMRSWDVVLGGPDWIERLIGCLKIIEGNRQLHFCYLISHSLCRHYFVVQGLVVDFSVEKLA